VKGSQLDRRPPALPSRIKSTVLRFAILAGLALGGFAAAFGLTKFVREQSAPPGMVWIEGGEFTMGTDSELGWTDEKPAHQVKVGGFFMDKTEVTNAQFREFVNATGYVTTAEKPVDAQAILRQLPPGTPTPTGDQLLPGSLVFTPTTGPVNLKDYSQWWKWTPGGVLEAPRRAGQHPRRSRKPSRRAGLLG